MSFSQSVWSRFSKRWASWQYRYEYPEAHSRTVARPKDGINSNSSSSTAGTWDPEGLMEVKDHPLHQTSTRKLQGKLQQMGSYMFWTAVHVGAVYVFVTHVKPRLMRYWLERLEKDDDDDDSDSNKKGGRFTRPHNKFTRLLRDFLKNKCRRRLCCCCDEVVSSKNNFCPNCGAPTCPLCAFCEAPIRGKDVTVCPNCQQPVPQDVSFDNMPAPRRLSRRSSSTSTTTGSPPGVYHETVPPVARFSPSAAMPPPSSAIAEGSFVGEKDESDLSPIAQDVPLVPVDEQIPLVPAMYVVQETTPATVDATEVSSLSDVTTTTATVEATTSTSVPDTTPAPSAPSEQKPPAD